MQPYTPEQLENAYAAMPETLRDVMWDEKTADIVEQIGEKSF